METTIKLNDDDSLIIKNSSGEELKISISKDYHHFYVVYGNEFHELAPGYTHSGKVVREETKPMKWVPSDDEWCGSAPNPEGYGRDRYRDGMCYE